MLNKTFVLWQNLCEYPSYLKTMEPDIEVILFWCHDVTGCRMKLTYQCPYLLLLCPPSSSLPPLKQKLSGTMTVTFHTSFIWRKKQDNVWMLCVLFFQTGDMGAFLIFGKYIAVTNEPRHEISNNVVCATSKASDQSAHTRSLIRAFASRLNNLLVLSYCLNIIWSF